MNRIGLVFLALLLFLTATTATATVSAQEIRSVYAPSKVLVGHEFSVVVTVKTDPHTSYKIWLREDNEMREGNEILDEDWVNNTSDYPNLITKELSGYVSSVGEHTLDIWIVTSTSTPSGAGILAKTSVTVTAFSRDEIDQQIAQISNRLDSVQSGLDQLTKRIENSEISISELQTAINQLQTDLNSINDQLSSIVNTISGIETDIADIYAKVSDLQARVDAISGRLDELSNMLNTLSSRLDTISSTVSDISAWRDSVESALSSLSVNNEELSAELNALANSLANLRDVHNRDIASINNQIINVMDLINSINLQITTLSQRQSETESKLHELVEQGIKLYNELSQSISSLQDEVTKLKQDIGNLTTELNQTSTRLARQESRLDTIVELFKSRFNADDIYDAIDNLKDILDEIASRIDELDKQVKDYINATVKNKQEIDRLDADIKGLNSTVDSINTTLTQLISDYNNYKQTIDENIRYLISEVDELNTIVKRLDAVIVELRKPQHISAHLDKGNLTVRVTTYEDEPVSSASLTIKLNNTQISGTTDVNGTYVVNLVSLGIDTTKPLAVNITSEKLGYKTGELSTVIQPASTPGFELCIAIVSMLAVAYIIRRRN